MYIFDFEKLDIYIKAKAFNSANRQLIKELKLDPTTSDQLRRASFSIVLNIAEGSERFSKADKRNFYTISRSSIFECEAILDFLKDEQVISEITFAELYTEAETMSKMLYAMIKNLGV